MAAGSQPRIVDIEQCGYPEVGWSKGRVASEPDELHQTGRMVRPGSRFKHLRPSPSAVPLGDNAGTLQYDLADALVRDAARSSLEEEPG